MKQNEPEEENSKPEEENSKPEEENSKPEEENSRPEEENNKPEEENSKPEEENSKPEEENSRPEEGPERIDKVLNILIAVFTVFILMFTTFSILKINSAIKSATILNRSEEASEAQKTSEEDSEDTSQEESSTDYQTITTTYYAPTFPELDTESISGTEPEENDSTEEQATEKDPEADAAAQQEREESNLRQRVNQAALSPESTGFSKLDEQVGKILSGSAGTPYDKMNYIYNYVIRNLREGKSTTKDADVYAVLGTTEYAAYSDAVLVYEAYQALTTRLATDSQYAAAFVVLARAAGFQAYQVTGYSYKLGMEHTWAIVNIAGSQYLFDPYLDDRYKENGTIQYYYFCQRQNEVSGSYKYNDKEGDIAGFGGFAILPAMTLYAEFGEMDETCTWISQPDRTASESKIEEKLSVPVGTELTIVGNVPDNEIDQWQLTLTKEGEKDEQILSSYEGGSSEYTYQWTADAPGICQLTLSARDHAGRICRITLTVEIIENMEEDLNGEK